MKTMNNTIINSIMNNAVNRAILAKKNAIKYICAVLMVLGVSANAWGATTDHIYLPAGSNSSYTAGDWGAHGAPISYQNTETEATICAADGYGFDISFYKAADYNTANGLQLDGDNSDPGYIQMNIASSNGARVKVTYCCASANFTIELSGTTTETVGGTGTNTFETVTLTTSYTSATLKITGTTQAVYIKYIEIERKNANSGSITIDHDDCVFGPHLSYSPTTLSENATIDEAEAGGSFSTTITVSGVNLDPCDIYYYDRLFYDLTNATGTGDYHDDWEFEVTATSSGDAYTELTSSTMLETLTINFYFYTTPAIGAYSVDLAPWYWKDDCSNYFEFETMTITLNVTENCDSRTITVNTGSPRNYGSGTFTPTLSSAQSTNGTKSNWASSNTNVATINSSTGLVTIVGAGSTTISVDIAESGDYCAVTASGTLVVNAVAPTVSDFTVTSYTNNKITVSNANASQITNKGGANITRYGYIYSTTASTTSTLTFGASGVSDANVGTNNIALNTKYAAKDITGLSAGTTYYVRAYAYNGTAYGYSPNIRTVTTKCAVTYAANGGTGSTTDASSPYEKLSDVTVLANGFTPPSGKKFVDWLGSDANHYDPGDVINDISTDMTLTAQWDDVTYKDYVFACVGISVSSVAAGKALVTSRKDVNVMATNPIKVTVSGAVAGHRVTFTNSVGLHFYKKVEGTGENAGKYKYVEATGANSFVTPLTNQEVYVSYEPTSAGTGAILSALPFTISCDGESQEFNTNGQYVKARNLPENVVIAAKTNGIYSALPANMGTTGVNPKPVIVTVATSGGVLTASGPSTLGYKLWPVKTVVSTGDRFGTATSSGFPKELFGDRLRFAGYGNHALWANNSGSSNTICNDLTVDSKDDGATTDAADKSYEWKVTTTEEDGQFVYTLQTDQTNNTYLLRLWGSKWGTYSAGNEQLYLLPLSPVTQADIKVMEWGADEIAVSYPNRANCSAMTAQIGEGDAATVTIASLGGDIYKLTGVGTLTSNAAKLLTLTATESGNSKQALFIIPYIISSGTGTPATMRTATGDNTSNAITRGVEVVVRSGAKFEVDASTKLMTSDMYIYPGGLFEIASGRSISMTGLYLRGGYSWLGSSFAMPHAKINASIDGLATGNGLNYDYYIDASQYYDLAVPKTMTWVPVTDETGNENFTYWVKQYNGETRASTGKGWEWYDWSGAPSTWAINMGQGYLVAAQPPTGRSYFIMRFPLSMTLPGDETDKDPIAVTAYGMTGGSLNPGVSANNAGWNLIANPFLTAYMKDADGETAGGAEIEGSIATGSLEPEYKDGKPTGKYEWEEGSSVRYVTTFNYATQTYQQHPMSTTTLEPFTGFFIQVAKDCYVKFDANARQNSIIVRRTNDKLPDDMEIGITASIGEEKDETILLLCDDLSRDNALEFPDESSKVINAGHLNFYTFAGTTSMYANGMTYAEGQEWNAAGITPTKDGEYTFSVTKVNTNYVKAVLLKDLNSNTEYDLLTNDVNLYLEAGTIDDRFALKIVLKDEEETPTALDEINEEGINRGPEKFIYNDKMYIRYNGIIYDATGKKVREINK